MMQAAQWLYARGDAVGNALRRRLVTRLQQVPRRPPASDGGIGALAAHGFAKLPLGYLLDEAELGWVVDAASAMPPGECTMQGDAVLAARPAAYRAGLHHGLIGLAAAYLEEPCYYLGATLKREAVGAPCEGTRQWHLDIEDARMLRVVVYLNDVAPGGGPFEYIAAGQSDSARAALRYRSGYVSDADMARAVPRADWTAVFGAAGDALLFDGTRLFHRAQPPRGSDRLSITFAYTTRRPYELRLSARLSATARHELVASIGAHADDCLPPARLF